MNDDSCEKCGKYAGGGTLCLICEQAALKKNARKPRRKKADPCVNDMVGLLRQCLHARQCNAPWGQTEKYPSVEAFQRVLARVEATFK